MVSERCGRLASSAKGFRGPASTLGWPVRGSSSHRAGGSAAISTRRWGEDADRAIFHGLTEQLLTGHNCSAKPWRYAVGAGSWGGLGSPVEGAPPVLGEGA